MRDYVAVALGTFILVSIGVSLGLAFMALPAAAILALLSVLGVLSFTFINYFCVLGIITVLFLLTN